MKLKLILAILLLPFSAMAANTNVFDRVLIRSIFQFTGGSPAANLVLTSDANGFYTPQSIVAINSVGLTNITMVNAPYLVASGQGTRTITLTGVGTVVTNNMSTVALGALTVTTLNGLTPANIITNITTGTGGLITWTGQGTSVFVPTINVSATGGVVTNQGSPTFSNVTISNSTTMNGGVFFKLVVTPTNYTDSVSDYAVAYKGTTATQVTNFLPAISTTITNGFTLSILDEQRGAGTTNIVILPNGTDTVNLTTNKYINVNGQGIDLIVDAVNKNWIIK